MSDDAYTLHVSGCDDDTVVRLRLTEAQVRFLVDVAGKVTAKGGGCSPTMRVVAGHHDDSGVYEAADVTFEGMGAASPDVDHEWCRCGAVEEPIA